MIRKLAPGALLLLGLAGCAETPYGPTVQVMPGPNKPFAVFQADDAGCRQFAAYQVQGQADRENTRAVGATLLGAGLGAGLGAAVGGGYGAGIGAASGGALGVGIGAGGSGRAQGGIQAQYDIAYAQCMYSKGNVIPGYSRAPAPPPGYGVPQGYAPQGYRPQGYAPQGYAPQGYAPQGYAPQAYPQGYGAPQSGYAPD